MKLWQDFGVSALFGTIVLLGSFALLFALAWQGKIDAASLVALIGSWVTSVTGLYAVSRIKTPPNGGNGNLPSGP